MDHNPSNDSAFPQTALNDPGHPASVPGLTKREWFAGQVAPALYTEMHSKLPHHAIASFSVKFADTLLEILAIPVDEDARAKPEHVETVAETVAHALLLGVATKRGVNGSSDKFNLQFGEGQEMGIWFSKNAPGGVSCGADDIIALRAAIASRRPSV